MNIYLQSYEAQQFLLLATLLFFGTLFILKLESDKKKREEIEVMKIMNPHNKKRN